ncbi:MAG: MATE family efflux transporter, partial [Clostridia bacterium]|nr:MATE family efflux transporter [Clostridia bacterium]
DTLTGLRLSLISNVINVAGNAFFIFVLHMGAAGAAAATVIARAVCAVAILWKLRDRSRDVYIDRLLRYRPDIGIIRKMLRIGVPHGIESSMFQFGRLATQVLISGMGTAAIAANSVALTLASYLYMPSQAIADTVITVVGRSYGAGEYKLSKYYARLLLFWEYLCMWGVSLFLVVFGRPIIGIYRLSPDGARIALQLTFFHCLCTSLIRPLAFVFPSVFRATGDSRFTMVISTLSMWIVRVGFSYVFALETVPLFGFSIPGLGMGIMGVWVAMAGDWVVRAVVYTVRFLKGTWLKKGI